MRVGRAVGALAGGLVAAVVLVASVAWACTIQARIVAANPDVGPALSTVSMRGEGVAARGSVEIRWNSVNGEVLGTAVADERGNFAAAVSVPDVAPGVYYLVATAGGSGVARTAFEVTPRAVPLGDAPPATRSADRWSTRSVQDSEPSGDSSDLALAAGTALMATGLVALFSGFTLAAVRRRRVGASSSLRRR